MLYSPRILYCWFLNNFLSDETCLIWSNARVYWRIFKLKSTHLAPKTQICLPNDFLFLLTKFSQFKVYKKENNMTFAKWAHKSYFFSLWGKVHFFFIIIRVESSIRSLVALIKSRVWIEWKVHNKYLDRTINWKLKNSGFEA